LDNLKTLIISDTCLSEGLEHLPESCEQLFCNSIYPHRSIKLTEELEKGKCSKETSEEEYKKIKNQAFKETLDTHHRKYYIPEK